MNNPMNELLTVAIGVGLFYLLLNPSRVRKPVMFLLAAISYAVSILFTFMWPFGVGAAKAALVLHVLGSTGALVLLFIATSQFKLPEMGAAASPPPASGGDDEANQ